MKRVLIFFSVLLVCAGLAWIGGYNFDTRGFWAVYGAVIAIAIAATITAAIPGRGKND